MLKLFRVNSSRKRIFELCKSKSLVSSSYKYSLQNRIEQSDGGYSREEDNFNYTDRFRLLFPLGVAIVACDARLNEKTEKRLFKAAQFGLSHEIEKLIKSGLDVNSRHPLGWTPLLVATVNEHYEVVEILLKAGADPNMSDNFINANRTANEVAMHPIEVLMLRDEEFSSVLNNKATFLGFTPLHYAVLTDNLPIIKLLLKYGANPLLENDLGHKPITYAKQHGTVREFLEKEMTIYEEREKEKQIEERRRYPLEERLKKHIVGQEAAIAIVAANKLEELRWDPPYSPDLVPSDNHSFRSLKEYLRGKPFN